MKRVYIGLLFAVGMVCTIGQIIVPTSGRVAITNPPPFYALEKYVNGTNVAPRFFVKNPTPNLTNTVKIIWDSEYIIGHSNTYWEIREISGYEWTNRWNKVLK